jgi:hypothetical protein
MLQFSNSEFQLSTKKSSMGFKSKKLSEKKKIKRFLLGEEIYRGDLEIF